MTSSARLAARQRADAEKESLRHLRAVVRGTGWRLSRDSLFRELNDYFIASVLRASRVVDEIEFTLLVKPMAVDPVFWEVMGCQDNEKEPLSLRVHGAFVCDGVPTSRTRLTPPLPTPSMIAAQFVTWTREAAETFLQRIQGERFSDFVKSTADYVARRAYANTLICSLVLEASASEALEISNAIAAGKLSAVHTQTSGGRTFYERAADWLSSRDR